MDQCSQKPFHAPCGVWRATCCYVMFNRDVYACVGLITMLKSYKYHNPVSLRWVRNLNKRERSQSTNRSTAESVSWHFSISAHRQTRHTHTFINHHFPTWNLLLVHFLKFIHGIIFNPDDYYRNHHQVNVDTKSRVARSASQITHNKNNSKSKPQNQTLENDNQRC